MQRQPEILAKPALANPSCSVYKPFGCEPPLRFGFQAASWIWQRQTENANGLPPNSA